MMQSDVRQYAKRMEDAGFSEIEVENPDTGCSLLYGDRELHNSASVTVTIERALGLVLFQGRPPIG